MSIPMFGSLERWLEPQNQFEALRAEASRRFGPRCIDFAYANGHDGPNQDTVHAIQDAAGEARKLELQYTPYGGDTVTRRVAAKDLSAAAGMRFHWRDVVMTPGAMAALSLVFRAVGTEPHGEAVIVTPCWLDTPLYAENAGLRAKLVDMGPRGLDLRALERSIGPRTRVVVISQPNNPTGHMHRPEELRALADILARKAPQAMLLSDECHRDYLEDGVEFVSPAHFWDNTAVVFSFGKRWLLQGQRLGYLALSPRAPRREDLREMFPRLCRVTGMATPTALMQMALPRLMDVPPPRDRVLARRRRVQAALESVGAYVHYGDGTMFLYVEVPDGDAWGFARAMAEQGVLVLPGEIFHHRGYVRLSMTATDAMIDDALPILAQALAAEVKAA